MRVVIAGSSGLIGTAVVAHLRANGHEVLRLVRRAAAAPDERRWDPPSGRIDRGTFDGADAVVCLTGAGIGDRPWSDARKQKLRDSRIVPTEVLAAAVTEHSVPTFVSGSAVGFYGDTGDTVVDESAPGGSGFLADLVREWEAATQKAAAGGARVVLLRSGLVLSRHGGLLGSLRPLFALGLGARLGSGEQYLPWISLDDEVRVVRFVLEDPRITGAVNSTGPDPVTNAAFTTALGTALHRPTFLTAPGALLRLLPGGMGEETLLYGQRAVPRALLDAGFEFRHPTVAEALTAAVDR